MDAGNWKARVADVAASDPHLKAVVEAHGIPDKWARPPGFTSLVLLILEQQVSLASAAAAFARVAETAGAIRPRALLATTPEALRAVAESLGLDTVPTVKELEVIGERWRPNRSTAARLLWHGYLARRGRRETVVDLS